MNRPRARRAALAALVMMASLIVVSTPSGAAPYEADVAGVRQANCSGPGGDKGTDGVAPSAAVFIGGTGLLKAAVGSDGTVVVADTSWVRVVAGGQVRTILGKEPSAPEEDLPQFHDIALHGAKVLLVEGFTEITPTAVREVHQIIEVDRNGPRTQPKVVRATLEDSLTHSLAVDGSGVIWVAQRQGDQRGRIGIVPPSAGGATEPAPIQWLFTIGTGPTDLAVNADGSVAYVTGPRTRVDEVNLRTGETTELGTDGPVSLSGNRRVALDPGGNRLFVSGGTSINQIHLEEKSKATEIATGVSVGSLAYNPVTKELVVADLISCTIGTVAPAARPDPPQSPPPGPPVGGTGGDSNPGGGNPGSGNPAGGGQGGSGNSTDVPVLTETGAQSGGAGAGGPERVSAPGVGSGGAEGGGSTAGSGAPTDGGGGGGQSVTDPSQLTGTRAEGDFGQFNPMANTTGGSNSSSFVPFASGGGQGFGGFASAPAATDPFSGGGAFAGGGAGPGETVAAAAGAPPASVANPGPVGAAVPPPPAATPIAAGSPTPVQGWAGAPGEPAQGATRYAMVAQEGGGDLLVYGLLGMGGCCLLLGIGAGTRRGGKGPARAAASAPAKAWAVGR